MKFSNDSQDTSRSSDANTNIVNAPSRAQVLSIRTPVKILIQVLNTLTIVVTKCEIPIISRSGTMQKTHHGLPLCENTTPLNALNEHSEIVVNSNDDNSSSDDDSPYGEDIEYVDASPPDTISLREKLLNINLLIAKIDALRDNPTPSSEVCDQGLPPTFLDLFFHGGD
ncbi:hypothetical protein Tco_1317284 [Tanacetum coccineum]